MKEKTELTNPQKKACDKEELKWTECSMLDETFIQSFISEDQDNEHDKRNNQVDVHENLVHCPDLWRIGTFRRYEDAPFTVHNLCAIRGKD